MIIILRCLHNPVWFRKGHLRVQTTSFSGRSSSAKKAFDLSPFTFSIEGSSSEDLYTLPEHKSEYRSVDTLYSRNGLLFEREKRWSSLLCVFLSEVTTVTTSSWILFFLCRLGWHNYLSISHWIHTFDDICDGSMKAAPGGGYLIHRISISHYKRRNSLRKHSLISFSLRLSSITSLISLFIANWVIQNGFSSR